MNFTNEELKYLKKYENNFNTAINHGYTRNIPTSELTQLEKIYKRVTNDNSYKLCMHCSVNILRFIAELGKMYYAEQKIIEETPKKNGTDKTKQNVKGRERK